MKNLLLSLLLVCGLVGSASLKAAKDLVVKFNGMELTLTQKKCENKGILEMFDGIGLKDEFKDKIFQGSVVFGTEKRQFCFVVNPNDLANILLIDEVGDGGNINIGVKVPGV